MWSKLVIPADWNKELNPTDELELFMCDGDKGKECIISFPENKTGDYYAQANVNEEKAKMIVTALRTHFNF